MSRFILSIISGAERIRRERESAAAVGFPCACGAIPGGRCIGSRGRPLKTAHRRRRYDAARAMAAEEAEAARVLLGWEELA